MEDWPEPEELEEDHAHPIGWFQIAMYVSMIAALVLGIWFLFR